MDADAAIMTATQASPGDASPVYRNTSRIHCPASASGRVFLADSSQCRPDPRKGVRDLSPRFADSSGCRPDPRQSIRDVVPWLGDASRCLADLARSLADVSPYLADLSPDLPSLSPGLADLAGCLADLAASLADASGALGEARREVARPLAVGPETSRRRSRDLSP
jgi:hypothetical protein